MAKPQFRTMEEAVEVARGLAPKLRERVGEAEKIRQLPKQNVRDLLDSGLIDLETPRRFDGAELNLDALMEVTAALAEGCSATGWVYALWGAHVWLIGQYPLHIQEQVFNDPESLVSSVVSTEGIPQRVDGGFTWTGKGFFSSGVDHCNWLIAAVALDPTTPMGDRRWFLLRRSDFEIVDDWHTVGLRGSGSKTIAINDVFIPDERVIEQKPLSSGQGLGAQLHGGQLYCAAMDFTFSLPLGAPVIGIARALSKAFEERMKSRLTGANTRLAGEQAATLTRFAKAGAEIEAARALLMETARRFCYMPGDQASDLDKAECKRNVAYATQLARSAANSIFEASGGSSIYETKDIQRLWRDANVSAMHHGLMWDIHGLAYGRAAAGLSIMDTGVR